MKIPILALFLCLSSVLIAQQDSCGCYELRPLPDLFSAQNAFANYKKYQSIKPYTGICHLYYMKVAYKIPDYNRTLQYAEFKEGVITKYLYFNSKGDTTRYYHRIDKDSIIGELRYYNYQTGMLESRQLYYYSGNKKLMKVTGYDPRGWINSESWFFFPRYSDSLNYSGNFINYKKDAVLSPDNFYNTPVQSGPYFEFGGVDGKIVTVQGAYFNNYRSGNWIERYPSGQLKSTGGYSQYNWKHGNWKEWYSNGQLKSDIDYGNSNPCGTYKEWYENGVLKKEQNYRKYRMDGEVNEYWENGKLKSRNTYEDGHILKLESWYNNGQPASVNLYSKEGKPIGHYRSWYENGVVKAETHYDSLGNHDQPVKEYYPNGILEHEVVYSGLALKMVRWYYDSGKLKSEEPHSGYSRHGMCTYYYASGKLQSAMNYKDGRKDGNSKTYSENGTLISDLNYSRGQWDSLCKWYFPNGKIWREAYYEEGIRNGSFKEWDRKGHLVYTQEYDAGKATTSNTRTYPRSRYNTDSLRNVYRRDAEVAAACWINNYDARYDSLYASLQFKNNILADIILIVNFLPPALDSVILVHSDSAQWQTHIYLDYPISALRPTDTTNCDSWPKQLDSYVSELQLIPVPGECYGADMNRIRRGFTSELFFNGIYLDSILQLKGKGFGCEYFGPNEPAFEHYNSGINVQPGKNFSDYRFYIKVNSPENSWWRTNYTAWTFRVYDDGSVDYREDFSGAYTWSFEY